jgi:hypothetical protein
MSRAGLSGRSLEPDSFGGGAKPALVFAGLLCALVGVGMFLESRPAMISCENGTLRIKTLVYSAALDRSMVDSISRSLDGASSLRRTNGLEVGSIRHGNFIDSSGSRVQLFLNGDAADALVFSLHTGGGRVAVSANDAEKVSTASSCFGATLGPNG